MIQWSKSVFGLPHVAIPANAWLFINLYYDVTNKGQTWYHKVTKAAGQFCG